MSIYISCAWYGDNLLQAEIFLSFRFTCDASSIILSDVLMKLGVIVEQILGGIDAFLMKQFADVFNENE